MSDESIRAIGDAVAAHARDLGGDENAVVGDFVVVYALSRVGDDGDVETAYDYTTGPTTALHAAVGLVDIVTARLSQNLYEDEE